MTRIATRLLETAFLPAGTPSIADVLARVEGVADLAPTGRRDLASGLRRVAKALDRPLANIPADPAWLQPRLARIAPSALGFTTKSWSDTLSDARAALATAGIVAQDRAARADDAGLGGAVGVVSGDVGTLAAHGARPVRTGSVAAWHRPRRRHRGPC